MISEYDQKKSQEQLKKFYSFTERVNHFFIKYLPKYDELDSYTLFLMIISLVISSPFTRSILSQIMSKDLWYAIGFLLIIFNLVVGTYYTFKVNETIPFNRQGSITKTNALLITSFTLFAFFYLHFDKTLGDKNIYGVLLAVLIYYNFAKVVLNAIVFYVLEDTNAIKKMFYSENNAKLIQIVIVTILVPFQIYINLQNINSLETFVIYTFSIYSITSLFAHLFNKQQINN